MAGKYYSNMMKRATDSHEVTSTSQGQYEVIGTLHSTPHIELIIKVQR